MTPKQQETLRNLRKVSHEGMERLEQTPPSKITHVVFIINALKSLIGVLKYLKVIKD